MSHDFFKGVRQATAGSTWHRNETLGDILTAGELIDWCRKNGAWPTSIAKKPLHCDGVRVDGQWGVIGEYIDGKRCLGTVGNVWTSTLDEWTDMVRAAGEAGAEPLMGYSLVNKHKQPSKVLATFNVNGHDSNVKTHLLLLDSFDGSTKFSIGLTSVDVVCANTLSVAWKQDSKDWAQVKHNGKAYDRIELLKSIIPEVIKTGRSVRDLHDRAQNTILAKDQFDSVFDMLFPDAADDATGRTKTRAANIRAEAVRAVELPINARGNAPGSIGTLWNAATWLNDRELDGSFRKTKGSSDPMINMLLGTRAKRVQEVQEIIRVAMADGSYETMSVDTAQAHGVDDKQIGASLLSDMLGGE